MSAYITTCDECQETYDYTQRHVVVQRRPSCPEELVTTFAVCPPCGTNNNLPTPVHIEALYEQGLLAKDILWLSL